MTIRVLVSGAGGRMGREVVKAVHSADDMELVGAVDPFFAGQDAGELAGLGRLDIAVAGETESAIQASRPEVVIDFTWAEAVRNNARLVIKAGVHLVIGTTGLNAEFLEELDKLARSAGTGVIHAPNFSIGAVLMMRFAKEAARFYPGVEIIELHHDKKRDAPSGTAIKTAQMIMETWQRKEEKEVQDEIKLDGARGGDLGGIHIHSVRLPGLVAHQEVLFGRAGELLKIRHDSLDRASFMPGVLLAARRVKEYKGLVYGLEHLLFQ